MSPQFQSFASLALPNARYPTPNLIVGGAPSESLLKAAADAGIRFVLDLRPENERNFDEPSLVAALGMDYLNLPIAGASDLTLENTKAMDKLIARIGETPALIHCASGNRVGALMALRASWIDDLGEEAALQIGRDYGLTKMEHQVQALLSSGPT
jgi:protein tyrosine phosphatase (PTP) superfamily phosphohydrolase (DUF442 family)